MKKSLGIFGFIVLFLAAVCPARATQQLFHATLNGSQEVPPHATTARGDATVLLDDVALTITCNLSFTGLSAPATAAHIHEPANPGTNAALVFPFSGVPAATSGSMPQQTFAITAGQIADLRAGRFYINIHDAVFPGGEIRGQLLAAPPRTWTSASSVGTVDEDSLAIFAVQNFTVGLQTGATGTVTVRYNITPVDDVAKFCPADFSGVNVRFRNSDASGSTARVTFEIHTSNVISGGNTIVYTFDSNTAGAPADSGFHSVSLPASIDFDFSTNVYWIEARIFRSNASQFANLGAIQIWESNGAIVCP
jgi:CHRD domain